MVAQLAVPEAQYLHLIPDDGLPEHLLVQPDDSYVAFSGRPGNWLMQQGGPDNLWEKVEAAVSAWQEAGEPPLNKFHVTVSSSEQRVHLQDTDVAWPIFTHTSA
jgi:hypothetical protein